MIAGPGALLARLADGKLHPGAELARALGVGRRAVAGLVEALRARGVPVERVPRHGYRLPRPVELLDAAQIAAAAGRRGVPPPGPLEVVFETGSTNVDLYEAAPPPPGRPRILFAEIQHSGRGRRGRSWVAPFGSGLTFSVAWTFAGIPPGLSALGLALGVAAAEVLRRTGADEVRLKWPNDIVWRGRKLGGLLLQLRAEVGGPATVVAGLGLNLDLPDPPRDALSAGGALPVADLREATAGRLPGRCELAGLLAAALLGAFAEFGRNGYGPFAPRWAALDALAGSRVRVESGDTAVEGEARGSDADGALLVAVDGRLQRFHSGDVSLRPAAS